MNCSMPGLPVHHQPPEFTLTHVHRVGDAIHHLILCRLLLLLHSIFPSIRVFSNESALRIKWPKYWSFNFSISPSNENPGLTSFRMDWLDLLAVQGTLKRLLQHHSSKTSIFWCSAFFIVQLSHPYMTTGKTIALTRRTIVGKVMSLLFNMLSRFVIAFLSRSKHSLISCMQSPSAVILVSSPYLDVSVQAVPLIHLWIQCMIPSGGFPHSEISGSTLICSSPKLIAAYHVLHRLLMPRHSPCALISLTFQSN